MNWQNLLLKMSSLLDSWDGRKYTCLFLIILVFMVVIYVKGRRELMFNSSSRSKTHVRIGLHNYEQTTHGQASCSYLGKPFHHLKLLGNRWRAWLGICKFCYRQLSLCKPQHDCHWCLGWIFFYPCTAVTQLELSLVHWGCCGLNPRQLRMGIYASVYYELL